MADTVVDISGAITSGTLTDGTIFTAVPQGEAGTGNYDTFLVLGAKGTESGFNTDGTPLPLDDGQQEHTNALLLSDMQVVTLDGHNYYVFKLDANEPNSTKGELLSLNSLQIYSASDPNIATLPTLQTQQLLYDLDGNATDGDVTVQLNAGKDAPAGSGKGDMFVYIPTSFFDNATGNYVYLYSAFGDPSDSDGGFEEWGVITKASVDNAPAVAVDKTVDPTEIDEGDATTVTYTYKVTNTSADGAADPLTLTGLVDDNATPGDTSDDINLLNGFVANSSHGTHYVSGDTDNDYLVDSNETWIFTADVNIDASNAGSSIVNTVVVHAHDDDSTNDVTDSDDATVTVDDVAPTIHIEKTADPVSIDEGSATDVTYTYEVTNTSAAGAVDPLTLTGLVDDNATPGDATDDIDLLDGFVAGSDHGTHYVSGDTDDDYLVDSDETWTFTATVGIDAHNAGSSIVNTVVVHAHDDDSTNDVTDSDDATVTVDDVAPTIQIEKTADPVSINEGSATDVTYTYEVTNTSAAGGFDPLTLTGLVDDNATPGDATDDIDLLDGFVAGSDHGTHYVSGDTDDDYLVDSDETWTFTATVGIDAHNAGSSIVNTVVVHAHDDDSTNDVTDSDDATVTVDDVAPTIQIEKTADPVSIDEGSATDVTYTYEVTNTSAAGGFDPLTLTGLVDDNATPGDATDDIDLLDGFVAGSDHGTHYVSGDTDDDYLVDSDETWTFTATVGIDAHNAGSSIVNTVVVHAHDDDSTNDVTDTDDATVTVDDVAPTIHIEKTADPVSINEGSATDVTYTYEVTNTSAAGGFDPLTLTGLVDDNATPGDATDDIDLLDGFVAGSDHGTHYVSGDTDDDYLVDSDETWTFSATVGIDAHNAGTIVNTVVVHAHDDDSTNDVTDTDDATVTVKDVAPSIAIDKTVDGDHDGIFHSSELTQSGPQNVTYHYAITNTSPAGPLDPLTLTSLIDDNGTANIGDDINLLSGFVANSSHGTHYLSGDTDNDYLVDSNETWTFEATTAINLLPGGASKTNLVTVAAHDDDSLNSVTAQDTATVTSFAGPGVRTPGFWTNLGKSFWDGVAGADKSGPNFASGELRYVVDFNNDKTLDPSKPGLLIGDYNKNGLTDAGEDTFFISYADALKVIDASAKDQQDTRFVLARDAVATWLNFLAGNPIGDATDPNSPHKYLDQAIDWLQVTNGGNNASQFEDWGGGSAVKANTAAWNVGLETESSNATTELAGNLIHQELDFYNNTGMTFEGAILHIYANDGG